MVEAKDPAQVDTSYDPEFRLTTDGVTQDLDAFRAGHERVHPTEIGHAVAYDDDAWVEAGDRLAGRLSMTTTRPGTPPRSIEVVFVAVFRDDCLLRPWELAWPDRSGPDAFADYRAPSARLQATAGPGRGRSHRRPSRLTAKPEPSSPRAAQVTDEGSRHGSCPRCPRARAQP